VANKGIPWLTWLLVLLVSGAATAGAAEDEPTALTALVKALHDRGVIDEQQYTDISARAAAAEAEQAPGWWERLSFWGDFRGRYEGFFYQNTPDGQSPDDQQRGRYRLRLGMASQINDYARVVLQFSTGGGDNRSGNQTFGGNLDWGKDLIEIDQAYLELNPFPHDGQLPLDGSLLVDLGRMPNPFLWKNGRDILLWDNDINLEGAGFRFTARPAEAVDVFANTGFFIDDENSNAKDPSLYAAQIGANARATDTLTIGGRVSYFQFLSLNQAFVERAASSTNGPSVTTGGGNILDGLTGSAFGGRAGILATGAYLRCTCFEDWPVTLYGNFSDNLSAESSVLFPGTGSESMAWNVGIELGDKKRFAQVGAGYFRLEANAFPSMFVDSDVFDGVTNRKGWAVYGSREIFKNTDLNLTAFLSDVIHDALPAYEDSITGSHRLRLQADVMVKF
jgi:Putative porin